jgi:hypothetical protein
MRILLTILVVIFGAGIATAQKPGPLGSCEAKSTAAYASLVLRKVELTGESEGLLATMAADNPVVKAKQTELATVARELDQLCAVPRGKQVYLNENYAKLILRKVELAARLKILLERYTPEWPEARRAKAELTALEREMAKIME